MTETGATPGTSLSPVAGTEFESVDVVSPRTPLFAERPLARPVLSQFFGRSSTVAPLEHASSNRLALRRAGRRSYPSSHFE